MMSSGSSGQEIVGAPSPLVDTSSHSPILNLRHQ
jgi:hypothetical protein